MDNTLHSFSELDKGSFAFAGEIVGWVAHPPLPATRACAVICVGAFKDLFPPLAYLWISNPDTDISLLQLYHTQNMCRCGLLADQKIRGYSCRGSLQQVIAFLAPTILSNNKTYHTQQKLTLFFFSTTNLVLPKELPSLLSKSLYRNSTVSTRWPPSCPRASLVLIAGQ